MEQISIDRLYIDSSNVRSDYDVHGDDENTIDDLAQSIQSQGLMTPLSVRPDGKGKYKIYAGSRRYKAIQQLGWKEIPCIISNIDDNQAKTKSLVENFMRQGNSYSEKTKAFNELYNIYDKDIKKLEQLTGFKKEALKRYIKLASLPETVLEKLDTKKGEKRLTMEVAESLSKFTCDKAEKLANTFINKDITSKDMKKFITIVEEKDVDLSNNEEVDNIVTDICIEKAKEHGMKICDTSHFILPSGQSVDIEQKFVLLLFEYYKKLKKQSEILLFPD